jgi:hypothetical protein
MRLADLARRIEALEPNRPIICPFCEYANLDGWPDERLRELIDSTEGRCATISPELEKFLSGVPESSPECPHCQETA